MGSMLAKAISADLSGLYCVLFVGIPGTGALSPPINLLQGEQKRPLTPEEQERQKQLDDAYKAAAKKIPEQSANDPWANVRPAPTVSDPKKKQK